MSRVEPRGTEWLVVVYPYEAEACMGNGTGTNSGPHMYSNCHKRYSTKITRIDATCL